MDQHLSRFKKEKVSSQNVHKLKKGASPRILWLPRQYLFEIIACDMNRNILRLLQAPQTSLQSPYKAFTQVVYRAYQFVGNLLV